MKLNRTVLALTTACGLSLSPLALAGPGQGGAQAHFKTMDTDGDGRLSRDEHSQGARQMFETMDADKDGRVTSTEMTSAHEQVAGKKQRKSDMSAADKIKAVDTDGDGMLTAEEHATGGQKMFDKMDANSDGFLTKQEMSAGHAKHMKKGAKTDDTARE